MKRRLKPVTDVTKEGFLASDGIIAGSPVYFGGMAAEVKEGFDGFVVVRKEMGIEWERRSPLQGIRPGRGGDIMGSRAQGHLTRKRQGMGGSRGEGWRSW